MYKNQYDDSITVWSPEGRVHQVEYAMETVKMGTASVGVKSKTHAVLCSLQRSLSELASHQKKLFDIDTHCGVAISGMTADARLLVRWMRNESVNHRFVFDSPLLVSRLVTKLADSTSSLPLLLSGISADFSPISQLKASKCFSTNNFSHSAFVLLLVTLESQIHTQQAGRRPYGVGLLVAAYDVRDWRALSAFQNLHFFIERLLGFSRAIHPNIS